MKLSEVEGDVCKLKAWMGRALVVDLSRGIAKHVELPKWVLKSFIGGRGLGAKVVYDAVPRRLDPLHEDNVLVMAVGPLTGTPFYASSRFTVSSKSPLTGTIFDSNCGGRWGAALKASGLDALIVRGRAPRLTVLVVDEGEARLIDAEHLRGAPTSQAMRSVGEDLGGDYEVVCIGPAGENMARMACIRAGEDHVAGRGGLGAVMGSKRLKAIAVRGSRRVEVHDEEGLRRLCGLALKRLRSNPITGKALPDMGTPFLMRVVNDHGALPTRNFRESSFDGAEGLSAEALKPMLRGRRGCPGCPIACKKVVEVGGEVGRQPEYESLWALGPMCGVGELSEVVRLAWLCDELGLDTISTGSTIACAMELTEVGVAEVGVRWGDAEGARRLIEDIAYGRGWGSRLAEGSMRLASALGRPELSMSVKGLELPGYDPRSMYGQALAYATSNRGGCHLRAYMVASEILGVPVLLDRLSPLGKADLVALYEDLSAAVDSLVVCKFLLLELDEDVLAEALRAATGLPYTRAELLKAGERVCCLERLFNVEEGLSASSDQLPPRLRPPHMDDMLREYYAVRGWPDGKPSPSKLAELELPGGRLEL